MSNPLQSVIDWCDGVGHRDREVLYSALVLEEVGELALDLAANDSLARDILTYLPRQLDALSTSMRKSGGHVVGDRAGALDASLDIAWVALCLAYQLVGCDKDKLAAAWAELHRSNVTDKQVDGEFMLDNTGKVRKPQGWVPPNFKPFVR